MSLIERTAVHGGVYRMFGGYYQATVCDTYPGDSMCRGCVFEGNSGYCQESVDCGLCYYTEVSFIDWLRWKLIG